jgi:GNAT superfamily N-acetyltransferase
MLSIRRASATDATTCRYLATTLPDYFAAEDLDAIERDAGVHDCWIAKLDERPISFLIAEQRSAVLAEIVWLATTEKWRGRGIGTSLLTHVIDELAQTGVQIVGVKALDTSAGYEPYESTHAFWRRRGFVQVDTIDPLPGWRPGNPAAIYVAALTSTR